MACITGRHVSRRLGIRIRKEKKYEFRDFLLLLLIVSIFTGLFTEGIKKLLEESKKPTRQISLQEE